MRFKSRTYAARFLARLFKFLRTRRANYRRYLFLGAMLCLISTLNSPALELTARNGVRVRLATAPDHVYVIFGGSIQYLQSCFPCGAMFDLCTNVVTLHRLPSHLLKQMDSTQIVHFECPSYDFAAEIFADALVPVIKPCILQITGGLQYVLSDRSISLLTDCRDCGDDVDLCELPSCGTQVSRQSMKLWRTEYHANCTSIFRQLQQYAMLDPTKKWLILTSPHVQYLATLYKNVLADSGFAVELALTPPTTFELYGVCVVLGAVAFLSQLPPAGIRVVVQLEQKSSGWMTNSYLHMLQDSYAVIEYNLDNMHFFTRQKITRTLHSKTWWIPPGGSLALGTHDDLPEKQWDIVFYGDLRSKRRQRMLNSLKHLRTKVISETFGEDAYYHIRRAKYVLNLHFYGSPQLEIFRIMEALSLGIPVISEDAVDSNLYPHLNKVVYFFKLNSIRSMKKVINFALKNQPSRQIIQSVVAESQNDFKLSVHRLLYCLGWITPSKYNIFFRESGAQLLGSVVLSLPEAAHRRISFQRHKVQSLKKVGIDARVFDAIKLNGISGFPHWYSTAMSYSTIANLALAKGQKKLTIMEDDVLLKRDHAVRSATITRYLDASQGEWDVFVGLVADVHKDVVVFDAFNFEGVKFLIVDRFVSMVFNVYGERCLQYMADWRPLTGDPLIDTIDRYLESKVLRAVVAVPFLVGHDPKQDSTLWGIQNKKYDHQIAKSERILLQKYHQFVRRNKHRSRASPTYSLEIDA